MADPLNLALCSLDVGDASTDAEAFVDALAARVERLWDAGAELVVLPEYCWLALHGLDWRGQSLRTLAGIAGALEAAILPSLRERLGGQGKAVLLGTGPRASGSLINNTAFLLAEGRLHLQDKLHLTPWESGLQTGVSLTCLRFHDWQIATMVCLDIEVPELVAQLRGLKVDLILCPSATETELGVERIHRCASARAVELGCYVGVAPLVGRGRSDLVDENVGKLGLYSPSQSPFASQCREQVSGLIQSGEHILEVSLQREPLLQARRLTAETNPSLLRPPVEPKQA